ncbi:MAG: LUD domain-containing protein [Candidatus Saccharibacteria bacterium]
MSNKKADKKTIDKTIEALKEHGINTVLVENLKEAKQVVTDEIPKKSEVMTMVSVTLDQAEITKEIDESGKYKSLKTELYKLDPAKDSDKMRKLAAAPDYVIGSANAVSEDGALYWASATGSQLGAYAYTAGKVILVVGVNKIVKNREEAILRIYDYILPIESERARKAYGVPGSAVNKLLEISGEVNPARILVILVNEPAGY